MDAEIIKLLRHLKEGTPEDLTNRIDSAIRILQMSKLMPDKSAVTLMAFIHLTIRDLLGASDPVNF